MSSPVQHAGAAERLVRRTLPRALAASAQITLPARLAAQARRRSGRLGRVELYFAFDDPCSAVAITDLAVRLAARPVELALLPVLRRGIARDPAVSAKRVYAITDARRLARRSGLELRRGAPLAAADTAFLAEWVAGAEQGPELLDFSVAALGRLWFETDTPVQQEPYRHMWRERMGAEPQADAAAVRLCEARMARRGPYETPAVWVAGRWYFAHDRPLQICEWLDMLGWTAR